MGCDKLVDYDFKMACGDVKQLETYHVRFRWVTVEDVSAID
jgi:hypothetical protein